MGRFFCYNKSVSETINIVDPNTSGFDDLANNFENTTIVAPERKTNPVLMEKYEAAESKEILKNSIIDGDPFLLGGKYYKLNSEVLDHVGLGPKEKLMVEGTEIGLSGSFKVDDSRDAILGYVKTDEGYRVRSYYRSNSQGVWRCLPDYVRDSDGKVSWYGKAHGEESLTLPIKMQAALSEIALEGSRELDDEGFKGLPNFILAGTAKVYDSKRDYMNIYYDKNNVNDLDKELNPKPTMLPVEVDARKWFDGHAEPAGIDIKGPARPNFSKKLMDWESNASLYGHLKNSVYGSYDRRYNYVVSEDDNGRCFISHIERSGKITSYGLRSEWVSAEQITVPLYEYPKQDHGCGDFYDEKGRYVGMWKNYLSKLKVIQEYKASEAKK